MVFFIYFSIFFSYTIRVPAGQATLADLQATVRNGPGNDMIDSDSEPEVVNNTPTGGFVILNVQTGNPGEDRALMSSPVVRSNYCAQACTTTLALSDRQRWVTLCGSTPTQTVCKTAPRWATVWRA